MSREQATRERAQLLLAELDKLNDAAQLVATLVGRAEQRACDLIRSALGGDVVEQLLEERDGP